MAVGDNGIVAPASAQNGTWSPLNLRKCSSCECEFERPEVGICTDQKMSPLCIRCRFRAMDPFRPVHSDQDVLYLSPLSPLTKSLLVFQLELPQLRHWRKAGHELELRMLRLHKHEWDRDFLHQAWPRSLHLNMNGREVFVVKPPRGTMKRRDLPCNISASLKPGENNVKMRVDDERTSDFIFAVVRSLPRGPMELAKFVPCESLKGCSDRVRALVSARSSSGAAAHSGDVECVGDERMSLRCPITLQRLTSKPARGTECLHLQCFDLDAYLVSNYRTRAFNSRWRCPVCSFQLRPRDLCVDAFVREIVETTVALAAAPTAACGRTGAEAGNSALSQLTLTSVESAMEVFVAPDAAWRLPNPDVDGYEGGAPPQNCGCAPPPKKATCIIEDDQHRRGRRDLGTDRPRASTVATILKHAAKRKWLPPAEEMVLTQPKPGSKRKKSHLALGRQVHPAAAVAAAAVAAALTAGLKPRRAPKSTQLRIGQSNGKRSTRTFRRFRAPVPPPRHAIDVDSDAPPEEVSDSGSENPSRDPSAALGRALSRNASVVSA